MTTKEMRELNSNDIGDAFGTSHAKTRNIPAKKMSTLRFASEYNMFHENRGIAIILTTSILIFPRSSRAPALMSIAKIFAIPTSGWASKSTVHRNIKLREVQQQSYEVSRMDHSNNNCLLITILPHGELGYIYARDVQYKLDSLWQQFTANNCPTLSGKPKLLFIQACQSDQLDGGILLTKTTETDGESSMRYKIPVHADFLIAYSAVPGFYSWRKTPKGSWFVQALCHEFDRNGTKAHILELLRFVWQRVALDYESNIPDSIMMHQQKQIPCITTMLTKLLTFVEK